MRRPLAALLASVALAAGCSFETAAVAPELPENAEPSSVYAADGTFLTTFRGEEDRQSVPLRDIPSLVQNAVVAIEDERFWEHEGIDVRAVLRALRENTAEGEVAQGGSTITQQYVKNALLTPDQTLSRKVQEAALAWQLERSYSKATVLELYLNTVYFGNGAYGVQAAARTYFGTDVSQLGPEQAALLAGLIQAPSRFDPYDNPEGALERRDLVLDAMLEQRYLAPEAHEAAVAAPLALAPPRDLERPAPYPAAHFLEEVRSWILSDERFGDSPTERRDLLYGGGLRIHTTIDLRLQGAAEEAMRAILDEPGSDPDGALVAVDPRNGFVRAMVGGYDFFGSHPYAKLNLAMGKGRSTGSAFKPVVLAAALDAGVPESATFASPPSATFATSGGPWRVRGGGGLGRGSLTQCTVVSSNTCYASLILDDRVGPDRAVEVAQRLGITTPLDAVPAAVLGANDATVLDMASVYGTLANRGVHVPPVMVTRITRGDGTVLFEHEHTQEEAVEASTADRVSRILEGVITSGTGRRAAIGRPAAGKTGSAQRNTDAWFAGYTPELATAVWVGYAQVGSDGRIRSLTPPSTPFTVFGGTWPAQIWSRFMSSALAGVPPTPFPDPVLTERESGGEPLRRATPAFELPELEHLATTPDVVGQGIGSARSAVEEAGLEVRVVEVEVDDPERNPEAVLTQAPPPGTPLPAGALVTLEVSPPDPTIPVPSVVGRSRSAAVAALEEAGFAAVVEERPAPLGTPAEPGTVWGQRPEGVEAERGSDVRLFVQVG